MVQGDDGAPARALKRVGRVALSFLLRPPAGSLAHYRLLKKISTGTSGIVYQGQHNVFDDEPLVAIKVLRAQLNSPDEQDGFMQEARLLHKLKHKHILPIIDAGTSQGFPYIVEEALVAFQEASRLDPQCALAHRKRGDVFLFQRRFEEALSEYDEALVLNADDAESWQNKGTALCGLQHYPEALEATEKALSLDPELAIARQDKNFIVKVMKMTGQG